MNKSEDLFGDSSSDGGDTDDLLAEASNKKPPAAKKKAGAKKLGTAKRKRDVPDADLDDSDDDDDDSDDAKSDDGGAGLFDSDDSDDDDAPAKKKKLKKKGSAKKKAGKKGSKKSGNSGMSKREKMAALAKRRRGDVDTSGAAGSLAEDAERRKNGGEDSDGENSYDSREFHRTKEDDDFIDASGEDPDALEELYREQHFDDERAEGSESEDDMGKKRKKPKPIGRKARARGPDALSDDDARDLKGEEPPDNPIMAAVHKMKRKKKDIMKLSDLEDQAREYLRRMEQAAEEDEAAVAERRPATAKLRMLPEVLNLLTKQNMMRPLLDHDLLSVCRRWVKPLPKGGLGNVTCRSKLLQAIGNMTGENGVTASDLKRSGFGKTVMALYMHKSETPTLKRQHKAMIERWSRPIFQKSGNMKDLESAQSLRAGRAEAGITGYARAAAAASAGPSAREEEEARGRGGGRQDLSSIISGGQQAKDSVNNRVRVPFSKGFQFTRRPTERQMGDVRDAKTRTTSVKGQREGLHKRMVEKGRPVNKNQRSANISIEGRVVK